MAEYRIGIDIGSVTIGVAVIKDGELISTSYKFHRGDFKKALQDILGDLDLTEAKVAFTGRGTKFLPYSQGLDDIIAIVEGVKWVIHEPPSSVLMVGGESFLLIELNADGTYKCHEINTDCASGTGLFLEQQATRLGLGVIEFSEMAAACTEIAPTVATRCAVFAKTDLISRQQEGHSVASIAAGLCDGVAQTIVDTVIKAKELHGKLCLVGGVALNKRVVLSLEKLLGKKIEVLSHPELIPAIGAALQAEKVMEVQSLVAALTTSLPQDTPLNPPLCLSLSSYPSFEKSLAFEEEEIEVTLYERLLPGKTYRVYLGLDIGSTSTKLVVSEGEKMLIGIYTYTKSAPVQVTQKLLETLSRLEDKFGIRFHWLGAGTTGSGRQLVGKLLQTDLIINEITAHARAAFHLDPEVDTVIEIGGQDSKFIRLQRGAVVQSIMNYICAAGTGSFIEEQAKKLAVPLRDYADRAMGRRGPIISDRCTVYMERDLSRLLSEGWEKEELLASVLHSIRDNYLARVVGQAKIGRNICFQGATAKNKALVAAFEVALGKPIQVSPYCHLAGAYGVCLLLHEKSIPKTDFFGLNFSSLTFEQKTEVCELCRNHCKITLVKAGEAKAAWGFMCGREYEDKEYKEKRLPFESIASVHRKCFCLPAGNPPKKRPGRRKPTRKPVIGIPNALPLVEFLPLWQSFFDRLGVKVVVSSQDKELLRRGKNVAQAEFCAPIQTAHGHVHRLLKQDVDAIFFPIMLHGEKEGNGREYNFFCYYTCHLPIVLENSPVFKEEKKILSPLLNFQEDEEKIADSIHHSLREIFPFSRNSVRQSFRRSLEDFHLAQAELKKRGEEILAQVEKENTFAIVLIGRPYNIFDASLSQNMPDLIQKYGYRVLTQDMFNFDGNSTSAAQEYLERAHWYYGKKVLKAAGLAASHPRLFPVYITNFRCSPDAFLISYFKEILERQGKPYLVLQLDELSSDVGYQTRIEAALESFRNWGQKGIQRGRPFAFIPLTKEKTLILPHLEDVLTKFAEAVLKSHGYDALVAEETPESILLGMRMVGGGECAPVAALLGSIVQTAKNHGLKPDQTAALIPTSFWACNFPQIPLAIKTGLKNAGLEGLEIFTTEVAGQKLPIRLNYALYKGYIVGSLLHQMAAKLRPYEIVEGETERRKWAGVEKIRQAILNKHNLLKTFEEVIRDFSSIRVSRSDGKRPLLVIFGDLYVVCNWIFNFELEKAIEKAGGEVLPPSFADMGHFGHLNQIEWMARNNSYLPSAEVRALNAFIRHQDLKFRRAAKPVLGRTYPLFNRRLLKEVRRVGIPAELEGETALNLARIFYYWKHIRPDAFVHINPLYCCPGVVTTALARWAEEKLGVPIIHLFYDGISNPNESLRPYIHYLREKKMKSRPTSILT